VSQDYFTGIYYYGGNTSTSYFTLATITLSSGTIPTEFQIGILDDNSNSDANNTNYKVIDGSTATTSDTAGTGDLKNDFYNVDVTGASSGNTIIIEGESAETTGNATIGGLTFDTIIPAPEPATVSLLAIGSVTLLLRRRRRQAGLDPTPS
jgi:hypothetical protein